MRTSAHCTVSNHRRGTDALRLALLTLVVLLIHGFHPWAEDGGLYLAGVELRLQPALFPLDRPFVSAPTHYSLFAPLVAWLVHLSHQSLAAVVFVLYLLCNLLLLYAALGIMRRCFASHPRAQWTGVALLAAWCTLPVAGTSLLLMDPYLTARSVSTPLTLLAIQQLLQSRTAPRGSHCRILNSQAPRTTFLYPSLRCLVFLLAAALFHPLMAIYAALFSLTLLLYLNRSPAWTFGLLGALWLAAVGVVQALGHPEPPALQLAVSSRYYWFLANWQWFEWLGLFGPLLVFFFIGQLPHHSGDKPSSSLPALCRSSLFVGVLGTVTALLFAQEHFAAHAAARLQPLRCFLPLYALLPLLLGGTLGSLPTRSFWQKLIPTTVLLTSCCALFAVQRASFPASPHIEWPGRPNRNPWVEAFFWARQNTPANALFALDQRYINTPGEDAQSFRALAQRSTVPDFSKDGGEAANFSALAGAWAAGAAASAQLSQLSDAQRALRLQGLGVQWLILQRSARTAQVCPYRNNTVKICHL